MALEVALHGLIAHPNALEAHGEGVEERGVVGQLLGESAERRVVLQAVMAVKKERVVPAECEHSRPSAWYASCSRRSLPPPVCSSCTTLPYCLTFSYNLMIKSLRSISRYKDSAKSLR
eukprot:scaffold2352_cov153-Ochromonas_danica.AAC.5